MSDSSASNLPPPATSPRQEPAAAEKRRFISGLRDDINPTYAYIPLLACCLVSGLSDSVAFNASGVFVSMQTGRSPFAGPFFGSIVSLTQTGNTIFLALGASSLPANQPRLWLKAIVSIASFWAGCFLFSKFRYLHAQRKITLFLSCLTQTVFVVVAAALSQARVVPAFGDRHLSPTGDETQRTLDANEAIILLPIALLACQFGGQIVTSRVLGFSEIPTNVLTSLYCDLLSDPLLWVGFGANAKRNRRVAAFVLTTIGGIIGGWLQRSWAGMATPLWIAAAIKLVISVSWLFWADKPQAAAAGGKK